ncbi:MAG: adenylate/guanylate cyclase domain-containing protein [Bacteroidota bacterium]
MKLSPQSRRLLSNLFWSMIFFVIGVNLYSMVRFWEADQYPPSEMWGDIITATIGGAIGGLLLGLFHNSVLRNRFRRKSFGFLIAVETLIDLSIIILVFIPTTTLSGVLFTGRTWADSFAYNLAYMSTLPFASLVIFLLILAVLYNFLRQLSKKFGAGVMLGLLTGKYHNPRAEDRIFMFFDLTDSTTHAERLGHLNYSRLLQECFYDLNTLLLPYEAHIYKYVGDEAILTWKLEEGLDQAHCLDIFFAFHNRLQEKGHYYQDKYGFIPEFKAGGNVGQVTVAEVGEYRREIEYHGDVLNTAARIQGQCKEYGRPILISEYLYQFFSRNDNYVFEKLGDVVLKGKQKRVGVFTAAQIS